MIVEQLGKEIGVNTQLNTVTNVSLTETGAIFASSHGSVVRIEGDKVFQLTTRTNFTDPTVSAYSLTPDSRHFFFGDSAGVLHHFRPDGTITESGPRNKYDIGPITAQNYPEVVYGGNYSVYIENDSAEPVRLRNPFNHKVRHIGFHETHDRREIVVVGSNQGEDSVVIWDKDSHEIAYSVETANTVCIAQAEDMLLLGKSFAYLEYVTLNAEGNYEDKSIRTDAMGIQRTTVVTAEKGMAVIGSDNGKIGVLEMKDGTLVPRTAFDFSNTRAAMVGVDILLTESQPLIIACDSDHIKVATPDGHIIGEFGEMIPADITTFTMQPTAEGNARIVIGDKNGDVIDLNYSVAANSFSINGLYFSRQPE